MHSITYVNDISLSVLSNNCLNSIPHPDLNLSNRFSSLENLNDYFIPSSNILCNDCDSDSNYQANSDITQSVIECVSS